MEIVAFDTDDKADGSGKAKITWVSKGLLKTAHAMNSTGTTAGGWESSEMRTYLKNTVKPLIPETVRSAIVPVTKVQSIYNGSSIVKNGQTTTDDVWIPCTYEVIDNSINETMGATYRSRFTDNDSRIKKHNGTDESWWCRSATGSNNYRQIKNTGAINIGTASNNLYIALGFCT